LFLEEGKQTLRDIKMNHFLLILTVIAISIAIIEDLRRLKIPNWVTLPTMLIAIVYHSVSGGFDGFLFSAAGMAVGIGLFIIPYLMGGMGAGDAKLVGAMGAILGPKGILVASVLIILTGGIYGLLLFAVNPRYATSSIRRFWKMLKTFVLTAQIVILPPDSGEKPPVLRYAIPIAAGIIMYIAMESQGYSIFDHVFHMQLNIFSS
jgi:prepilin peptidase CpaA